MLKPDTHSELLTPAQAAPLIGLRFSKKPADRVSFWRAIHEWNVPHFRLGPRTIKFSPDDLRVWLRSRRVGGAA
jgi:hypothetical protein